MEYTSVHFLNTTKQIAIIDEKKKPPAKPNNKRLFCSNKEIIETRMNEDMVI